MFATKEECINALVAFCNTKHSAADVMKMYASVYNSVVSGTLRARLFTPAELNAVRDQCPEEYREQFTRTAAYLYRFCTGGTRCPLTASVRARLAESSSAL